MSESENATVSIGEGVNIRLASLLAVPGNIELHGEIEGDVKCAAIRIGPSGKINGSLSADHVEVEGRVASQVSTGSLILRQGSQAAGNIEYETVTIEAGAHIDAQLTKFKTNRPALDETPEKDTTDVASS
ncbi:bactofilin family protein [Spiribacter salinus]|uniref:bactofilin family protein n=1 Tax=Spiribacter salinus TaxID=1335746 RepID=UPI001C93CBD0|nr:polymer-forming cytoskeletal protein [Spiribacter salinus]MBY5268486.1 hypothetical protein [Spiribacter salinus]